DHERPDGRHQVPRGPIGSVGVPDGDPARHSFETEEVHRHEGDVEAEQLDPELDFAQAFVEITPGHLWKPVEEGSEDAEYAATEEDVVDVRHDPVGGMDLVIDGQRSNEDPAHATH